MQHIANLYHSERHNNLMLSNFTLLGVPLINPALRSYIVLRRVFHTHYWSYIMSKGTSFSFSLLEDHSQAFILRPLFKDIFSNKYWVGNVQAAFVDAFISGQMMSPVSVHPDIFKEVIYHFFLLKVILKTIWRIDMIQILTICMLQGYISMHFPFINKIQ